MSPEACPVAVVFLWSALLTTTSVWVTMSERSLAIPSMTNLTLREPPQQQPLCVPSLQHEVIWINLTHPEGGLNQAELAHVCQWPEYIGTKLSHRWSPGARVLLSPVAGTNDCALQGSPQPHRTRPLCLSCPQIPPKWQCFSHNLIFGVHLPANRSHRYPSQCWEGSDRFVSCLHHWFGKQRLSQGGKSRNQVEQLNFALLAGKTNQLSRLISSVMLTDPSSGTRFSEPSLWFWDEFSDLLQFLKGKLLA